MRSPAQLVKRRMGDVRCKMAVSELVAAYRLHSAQCTQIAQRSRDPEIRLALLPMAQSWLKLADQAVRNSETVRSEEHTSELQSRRDLVCRLLLEKKKAHLHFSFNDTQPTEIYTLSLHDALPIYVKWQLANSWRRIGYIPLNALKLHNAPETRKSDSRFCLWLNLGSSWRIKP